MANSKYEYVKSFERSPSLLPNTYMVVRIDGRGFHKLSSKYNFKKPNDRRALDLMNAAAVALFKELPDIRLACGISDEFSFVFDCSCRLFDRRESKILTTVVSTFTSYYVNFWPTYFPEQILTSPMPSFDGRVVEYPTIQNLRDYMSWRQVDCHINNLYNTAFWALVQLGGLEATQAEVQLKGTLAADKNELLFSKFGINYNNEPEIFKKGSLVYRAYNETDYLSRGSLPAQVSLASEASTSKTQREKERRRQRKATVVVDHLDIIKDDFWNGHPWLFSNA